MGILIRGGRIVDAATDTDMIGDIYLDDGMIQEIGEKLTEKEKNGLMKRKMQLLVKIRKFIKFLLNMVGLGVVIIQKKKIIVIL